MLLCMYIEQAATSKFLNLVDLNASSENFGFRGEVLASISEVSLLEIVTKTYGRPNGYRKVLKVGITSYALFRETLIISLLLLMQGLCFYILQGCKCLYLGIDDDRKEMGTTGNTLGESDSYFFFPVC